MRALIILAVLAVAHAAPLAPTRLRADGTDLNSEGVPAYALDTATPSLTWAPQHTERGASAAGYDITIYNAATGGVAWASGPVTAANAVRATVSTPLPEGTVYEWTIKWQDTAGRWSPPSSPRARFRVSLLTPDPWANTHWLGSATDNLYRAGFTAPPRAQIADATLFVCGLGYSTVTVNGAPAGGPAAALVTAPWTNNARRNGFSALDVTSLLPEAGGASALGVALGHGWRNKTAFTRHDPGFAASTAPERVLRAVLRVTLKGSGKVLELAPTGGANGGWTSAAGPVTADSVYDGEAYDARRAQALGGWDLPGYNGGGWHAATVLADAAAPAGAMAPWSAPPVAVGAVRKPVSVTPFKGASAGPGASWVVDFGVNQAGVCRLVALACPRGATVTLRHAEILQHAGLPGLPDPDPRAIYTANLRSARATDTYTCAGLAGGETWHPTMTYHGFRYVEVTVSDAGVAFGAGNLEMLHFHSAVPQRAHVAFKGSPTLDRLQAMALGAQRSNMMTVPTDCDQRDERLGWMGDSNLSGDSIALNYDAAAFLRSWVENMASEENSDGSLPDTVPWVRYGGRPGDVSWSAALVNTLHALWKISGDGSKAVQHWGKVRAQLANVEAQARKGLGKMHTPYGDWCPPPFPMGGPSNSHRRPGQSHQAHIVHKRFTADVDVLCIFCCPFFFFYRPCTVF